MLKSLRTWASDLVGKELARRWLQSEEENDWEFDPILVVFFLAAVQVPRAEVIAVLETYNFKIFVPQVDLLADALVNNTISISKWQAEMAALIKEQHIVSAIAGKGSRELMTVTDWGRTGGRLGFQYDRLDNFAREIMSGNFSPEYIKARSRMYINSTRTAYWDAVTQAHKDSGNFSEEARLLGPVENCEDCIWFAEMVWQPLGSLPEPGEASRCMSNCQCSKIYE